jgi:TonB family protein
MPFNSVRAARRWVVAFGVLTGLTAVACRGPALRVTSTTRTDGIVFRQPGGRPQPPERAEPGRVFLDLDVVSEQDFGGEDRLATFINSCTLKTRAGETQSSKGFEYERDKGPGAVRVFWNVPVDAMAFTLTCGSRHVDIDAPAAIVQVPAPASETAPDAGVLGGIAGGVGSAPASTGPILVGDISQALQMVERPRFEYPEAAKATGISGSVIVQVEIDEQGAVVLAHPLSGRRELFDAAVKGVRLARFKPHLVDGRARRVHGTYIVTFAR